MFEEKNSTRKNSATSGEGLRRVSLFLHYRNSHLNQLPIDVKKDVEEPDINGLYLHPQAIQLVKETKIYSLG